MKKTLDGLLAELLPGWMKGRILERYRRRRRLHRAAPSAAPPQERGR